MKDSDYWDIWAKDYSDEYSQFPLFVIWEFNTILGYIELKDNQHVLDLGTGAGILIKFLASHNKTVNFVGIDISKEQLDVAKKECQKEGIKARFLQEKMETIPLPDNSIDIVVSNAAIHHVEDKKKLFSEVYRVLRKNGSLAFADFFETIGDKYKEDVQELREKHPEEAEAFTKSIQESEAAMPEELIKNHPKEYHIDPYELKEIVEAAGFKNVKITKGLDTFVAVFSAKKL